MARRDPLIVVMWPTVIVRRRDGRTITLSPGCKSDAVSEQIRSALPKEALEQIKKSGKVVEEAPPWNEKDD